MLIGSVDDYPVDAHDDRRSFTTLGYKSGFALPLASAKEVLGCIGYVCTGTPMRWDRDLSARLRLIAEIFGSALARQHAEDALVGNEMLKTAILSSLASGVAVLDRQGCVIAMNERWTGLARDSGLGWADVSIGEDLLARARAAETREAERVVEGALGVLSGGLLRCVVPHQIAAPQGPRFWVFSIHPLDRPEGGVVMTYTEITERKRAELDAQTARSELAHMARVATLGELASSFAHQLNQPLTAIVANAQAGRRLMASGDRGGEVPSVLEDIAADGLRAGTVILRLREMLRKDDPRPVSIDVAALVEDVAALVANDALIREVSLRLSLPPSPLIVHGDRIQLQQAMLNVLMNAFEAVGDGKGGRLVEVDARALDGQGVVIEVRDTGPGLPMPATRVFEAFYTTKPYGMGMGLPIVRTIVEAHGGSVHAANSPRGGAVFSVRLPLASGEPGVTDVQTVYVVDDDHSVRRSLARLLRAAGYQAESFASAVDFLASVQCDGPACALIDVRMPEVSGFDLFQQLQQRCPGLPVIFITGHGDVAMAERATKAGASDFLVKPVDEAVLLAAVEQALAASRARLICGGGG